MFWFMVKVLIPKADYNETDIIKDSEGISYFVGDVLEHEMVPSETKPGEMRRNYLNLRSLNQVDAGTLIDYLKACPEKGTNNGRVQNSQGQTVAAPVPPKGFGGIKPAK
jgi:hypothetical protein